MRRYADLSLDFLMAYVWGRGCALGEPEPPVVAAALGAFEPGLVADLYTRARKACSLGAIRQAREAGATEALRETLRGADVTAVVGALRAALDAAEPSGRPLFAGLTALPWPADEFGALWHAATLLREHRGDAHLGACTTAGLTGVEANILTELYVGYRLAEYTATRGWTPEAMDTAAKRLERRGLIADGVLTAEGARFREDIEDATDRAEQDLVDALGDRLPALVETLEPWSAAVVARGWFPPDPYKRAAG